MGLLTATLASIGLALVCSVVFARLACSLGILFAGIDTYFAVPVATGCCAVVAPVTALVFKRKGKHFTWPMLGTEVVLLAFVAVGVLSWSQTQQNLSIFMGPAPVPNGVHVHQGRAILFTSYVHFSAPPAAIAEIIKSKELVEVSDEWPDKRDITVFSAWEKTKVSWGWWQPAGMSSPRFFFRHHKSDAVQGWGEGWWVNGATNEVYATIGR